jgi:hypothetical protein
MMATNNAIRHRPNGFVARIRLQTLLATALNLDAQLSQLADLKQGCYRSVPDLPAIS